MYMMYIQKSKRVAATRFDIVSKRSATNSNIKFLRNKTSYPDVVSRLKSTNCILEILRENQKTQSIRYFEAIVYNKKLLTNNERVKELPYYDTRYMRLFRNADDVDVDWCKEKIKMDYKNANELSLMKVVEFIKKRTGNEG